ncbi:hypothetical protein AALO_G00216600 [Alosa alosa]|uniref:Uncharacterized protein n=1 Tax=Alosa alosa TaxID=278164 RepID=A0AAV6G5N5_9TELE|nr:hypothetical protein AALO_G00216600 [Alosa alosa]
MRLQMVAEDGIDQEQHSLGDGRLWQKITLTRGSIFSPPLIAEHTEGYLEQEQYLYICDCRTWKTVAEDPDLKEFLLHLRVQKASHRMSTRLWPSYWLKVALILGISVAP